MINSERLIVIAAPNPDERGSIGWVWLTSTSALTLSLLLSFGSPSFAQTSEMSGGKTYRKVVGTNTETETAADAPASSQGFSISVDGERVAGDAPTSIDAQRKTDLGLEEVDIQVKFDGLDQKPVLNVTTIDVLRSYRAGQPVEFLATSNYRDWLSRQEVLIYPRDQRQTGGKVRPIVVPVDRSGRAVWSMPAEGPDEFSYVLRVYDKDGRFDETSPLSLVRTQKELAGHVKDEAQIVKPGAGDDRTAVRNIPIYGGAVTVYGRNVPKGYSVQALGEQVPVDRDDAFVIQRILPPGDHKVEVTLHGDGESGGLSFDRDVNIPTNDWFYVGLADLTVGYRVGDKGIEDVRAGEYDETYTKGRLAFYLKGKIKGKYLLTAAADTRDDKVSNLFRNLDAKDPRAFLARINPEEFYPVYGDDSTAFEDAPTRGKFYVRLERGESRVMWGNFKAKVAGSKFLRNERALYGASATYRSESKTSFGESRVVAEAYGANAETLPQRDVFLATGGSAYFLKFQDITVGSETISIQIVDPVSGRVIETRTLSAGVDYEIDHLQGVLILKRPLNSSTSSGSATRSASVGESEVHLVAQYEHTPTAGNVDGVSYGGRAQGWIGDHVRIGATGMKEKTDEADQELLGADLVIRHSETTYLEAEFAQSKGRGIGKSWSTDGGLTFKRMPGAGLAGKTSRAYAVRGQVDLADISNDRIKGTIGGHYEQKDAGFSSIDYEAVANQRVWGAFANIEVGDRVTLKAAYEDYSDDSIGGGQNKREGSADIDYKINENWKATFGARFVGVDNLRGEDRHNNAVTWNGNRTDLGFKLTFSPTDDTSIYAFAQATVHRSGNLQRNDRIGIGAETRLTDRVGVNGELSYGTSGWGALAMLTYDPAPERTYYVGYRLNPADEFDTRRFANDFKADDGSIVAGTRFRYNDTLAVFSEANTDIFGKRRSLTTTYGVTYTPDTLWTITGGLETGRIKDPVDFDFERIAPSFGISYKDEDRLSANLRAEARFEDSDDVLNSRDQTSYYFAGGLALKVSENWRALANVDAVISNSRAATPEASIRDGNYIEASLGAAYRPIANDRFNGLFKYVYLNDVPGSDQVSAITRDVYGPRQRSHILSVDGIYDVNRHLSVGAKYGFRIGQSSSRERTDTNGDGLIDGTDQFTRWGDWRNNHAHLGVVRADFHVVKNWDLLLEGRVLYTKTQGAGSTTDFGALAAVYRHIGDNMKLGVGYNFGRFSDDLRDQTFDDQGVFLNAIGKF